jgi:hypothetical protein
LIFRNLLVDDFVRFLADIFRSSSIKFT